MTLNKNYIAGDWVEGVDVNRNLNPSNTNDVVGEYRRPPPRRAGRRRPRSSAPMRST
jgi:aldehyde dehydrogenase (NAD+)